MQNNKSVANDWEKLFNYDERTEICGLAESENCKILPKFSNYMKFARLVMKLETSDVSWWSELDEISENVIESEVFRVAYNELKRKREILKFVHPYRHDMEVPMNTILESNEILASLIKSGFEVSTENYDELRCLVKMNETLLSKQNPSLDENTTEVNKLNECMISKIYHEMLQSADTNSESIREQVSEIRKFLKMITNSEILLNTLNQLLRATHQLGSSKINSAISINRSTDNMTSSSELQPKSSRNRLMCSAQIVRAILDSLRIFLMSFDQSNIYKLCDNDMKSKFDQILRDVDTSLWKLEIVAEKESRDEFTIGVHSGHNYSLFLDAEKILRTAYNSSDNNEMGQKMKMPSRKNLRKRKRSTLRTTSDSDGSSSDFTNIDLINRVVPSASLEMEPEELLRCCVVKCDYVNAGKIVEKFEIETRDARHTKFLINFRRARDELLKISNEFSDYAKDNKLTDKAEEIRFIAEKGLIRQKFIQTLKNFIAYNTLRIDVNCTGKSTLELALNAAVAIIFFLSTPCNYELTLDFYKFILKTFRSDEWKCQLFLTDLMDIMTICSNEDVETNIVEILKTETFILDPDKFKKELENRKKSLTIWNKDESISEIEKIQTSTKLFDQLECRESLIARNLVNYVRQMKSVIKQVTGDELNFDDIAKVDPRDLMGKILFELQYKPAMIDQLVNNSHMELLEYVAVVGERTCDQRIDEDEKLFTLFQLREFSGGSVANDLLNLEVENPCKLDIQKLDLLYHLKNRNFFEIKNIISLASLYDGNRILTALSYGHIDVRLLLKKLQESENLHEKIELLCSLSSQQWMRNKVHLEEIHDSYVEMTIESLDNFEEKLDYLRKIRGIKKFYVQLMRFIDQIDSQEMALKLLNKCKNCSDELDANQLESVDKWIEIVNVYSKISQQIGGDSSWAKQKKDAERDPYLIANQLLLTKLSIQLCSDFLKICEIDIKDKKFMRTWIEIINDQETRESVQHLFKVLDSCSQEDAAFVMVSVLSMIGTLEALLEMLKYLESRVKYLSTDHRISYQKFKISARMCELHENNYEDYFHLCEYPLLIIEQMLMNLELSKLRELLIEVRQILNVDDYCFACDRSCNQIYEVREIITCDLNAFHSDMIITNECIDLMLKCYATKAIDYEVIEPTSSNEASTIESSHSNFQMPREIPAKQDWTPDEAAKSCMCCQKQKFNLISRRHHCRRCGRVVCSDCSKYRSQLPEVYRDLSVRVCYDCNLWMSMRNDDENSTRASSEISFKTKDNLWRLTAIDATGKRSLFKFNDT